MIGATHRSRTAVIEIIVAYYLGIDGGGSKTTCIVGDEDSVLGSALAGPSNITRVGEARARESLHESVRLACADAKIDPRQVQRACVGVAGVASEEIATSVRKIIAELISSELEVVGDMQIALQAALGAGPGVVVIAGTGSIAYGRDAHGKTARAGGWGFAISDEGSAHWIGRMAIAALLRSVDRSESDQISQPTSVLLREIKTVWTLESFEQLARKANTNPDFAALLPGVLAAADAGDEVARQVLTRAGKELAELAGIVVQRLFRKDEAVIPLAMVGGVFRYAHSVVAVFSETLRKFDPWLQINPDVVEPVAGALQMARAACR
jgi:N-acetylglucosamine kinase-like BadF-type ATPase